LPDVARELITRGIQTMTGEGHEIEKSTHSIIMDDPDMREFIEHRAVKPEDFPIIEDLAAFPRRLAIEFHNFFSLLKERSAAELESMAANARDEEKRRFCETALVLLKKYDWIVMWNLIGVLERRKASRSANSGTA
jgi:hypothetical protein